MKTTDFITENKFIADDAHAMHQDHEVQMARSDCYNAAKYAIELHKLLKNISEMEGLDGWVSEKITLANDYLRTVAEYLRHEAVMADQGLPEMFTAESAEAQFAQLLGEDQSVAEAGKPDVMRHKGDKTVKIVKRGGVPIGEIGIDSEASPGNGQYYVKLYDGSYDAVGFDTAEEALAELKYAVKQGMAEGLGSSSPTRVMKKYLPNDMWDPILSHSGKSKHNNADGSKTSHVWRLRNLVRSFRGREFDAWKQAVEQELGSGYEVTSEWPTPSVRHIQMNNISSQQGVAEGVTEAGAENNPVVNAITRRIIMQRTDLLSKYGLEKVSDAIDEVADFVGDVEEIGSSDVSGWVRHVEQMLGNMVDQSLAETTSAGGIATVPGVGGGPKVGSLFGGSYTPKTPFVGKKKAKESVIKR